VACQQPVQHAHHLHHARVLAQIVLGLGQERVLVAVGAQELDLRGQAGAAVWLSHSPVNSHSCWAGRCHMSRRPSCLKKHTCTCKHNVRQRPMTWMNCSCRSCSRRHVGMSVLKHAAWRSMFIVPVTFLGFCSELMTSTWSAMPWICTSWAKGECSLSFSGDGGSIGVSVACKTQQSAVKRLGRALWHEKGDSCTSFGMRSTASKQASK
jgi:hypothetical protein